MQLRTAFYGAAFYGAALSICLSVTLSAQDAVKVDPKHYTVDERKRSGTDPEGALRPA